MKRVIIHIGTHKTGSTAFQNTLIQNISSLRKAGISYDWIRLDHNKHSAAYLKIGSSKATDESRTEIISLIKSALKRNNIVILSEEGLSEPFEIIARTFSKLSEFAHVTVVCVLRPQYELMEKLWDQRIREGRFSTPIEKFINKENTIEHCKYNSVLAHWAKYFGTENVKVLNFENIQGNSANQILKAMELNLSFKESFNNHNVTPNALKTRLIEFYNSVDAEYDVLQIINACKDFDYPKRLSLLSYEMKREIHERYLEENRLLETNFGIVFPPPKLCTHIGKLDTMTICENFLKGYISVQQEHGVIEQPSVLVGKPPTMEE